MFLDELTPMVKELIQQPIAFTGGFFLACFDSTFTKSPLKAGSTPKPVQLHTLLPQPNPPTVKARGLSQSRSTKEKH
jgi:hypothetical protein